MVRKSFVNAKIVLYLFQFGPCRVYTLAKEVGGDPKRQTEFKKGCEFLLKSKHLKRTNDGKYSLNEINWIYFVLDSHKTFIKEKLSNATIETLGKFFISEEFKEFFCSRHKSIAPKILSLDLVMDFWETLEGSTEEKYNWKSEEYMKAKADFDKFYDPTGWDKPGSERVLVPKLD